MTNNVMMMLGDYTFSLDTAAYNELKRASSWRWSPQERIDNNPAMQYTGKGADQIDLSGVILPHYKGGLAQINKMRDEADKGKPLLLVDGQGLIHGDWVILSIEETKQQFIQNGLATNIRFTMKLSYYGDYQ